MKKWSILISRYLLGIIFFINGINMFVQFMPLPNPQQPDLAQRFLNLLHEVGYFYPILGLNGILFHIRMDPQMAPVAIIVGLMQVYLIYINKTKYFPMLENGHK
jgi:putative oxidoreductase